MKSASCKAKGRRLQDAVAGAIREAFGLPASDVWPMLMGGNGMDIRLSEKARALWPYATEVKNQERINIWAAIKQAEEHADKEKLSPLVVFSKNRERAYVVVSFEEFVAMQKCVVR